MLITVEQECISFDRDICSVSCSMIPCESNVTVTPMALQHYDL